MAEEEAPVPATRCGYVALTGRPNTGKSSLLNRLVRQRISITSRKPQTTRHAITGIDTSADCQVIYVDTPGLHAGESRQMNRMLNQAARDVVGGVDLVLHVIEAGVWRPEDEAVLELLRASGVSCFALLNKVDLLARKEALLPVLAELSERRFYAELIPVSARSGHNIEAVQAAVRAALPAGVFLFPDDQVTDRSERFLAAELIREQLVRRYGDELPYQSAVQIEAWREDDERVHVHATILVERDSQKSIVLGSGGLRLRDAGIEARRSLQDMLERSVNLRLWVKVRKAWSDDARILQSLGYGDADR